jgi:3,4-dihydroxy 2-butanone 4-phosphate synthase/GTP cyclohydrolase II
MWMSLSQLKTALDHIRRGRMVILLDSPNPKNEGELVMAAEKVTPEAVNFMTLHARGIVTMPCAPEIIARLGLPLISRNHSATEPAFTVSIEARKGVTTGISAADRAATILAAVAEDARPEDLVRPGHIFPIRARRGGVLFRTGHTEGAVDLVRLAGMRPAAAMCGIMNEQGEMADFEELKALSESLDLPMVTIGDLITYRLQKESFVKRAARTVLPTLYGEFAAIAFENQLDRQQHLALVKGEIKPEDEILVRVHTECILGNVFRSYRCDCGEQLEAAMRQVQREGRGVILYLHKEGRNQQLVRKLKAYQQEEEGKTWKEEHQPESDAVFREFGIGAQILVDLGIRKIRLMTNSSKRIHGLEGFGLEVVERVPLEVSPSPVEDFQRRSCDYLGKMMDAIVRHQ